MTEEIVEQLHRDKGADPHAGALGWLIDKLGVIFAVGLLVAAGILVIEIFLRYVLNSPTIWAHETVIFLTATAFVYGGLYTVARNAHIRVVLIYDFLPKRIRRYSTSAFRRPVVLLLVCSRGRRGRVSNEQSGRRLANSD